MAEDVVHVPGDPFPFLVHGQPLDLLARGPQMADREAEREHGAECRGDADEDGHLRPGHLAPRETHPDDLSQHRGEAEQQRVAQRQQHESDREGEGQIRQVGRRREKHGRCRPEEEHHGHDGDAAPVQRHRPVPGRQHAADDVAGEEAERERGEQGRCGAVCDVPGPRDQGEGGQRRGRGDGHAAPGAARLVLPETPVRPLVGGELVRIACAHVAHVTARLL
ncbi:hypothetical protein [Streptomyces sp. NRRL F-5053]|uniref:hypothetical protein n=1 Tax=Streptomyces sp. NRRL F-5053 TaxID=1463854 RepID=UPI001F45A23F|nr:hypothetical protein [Streptomyces sp. NRRL F-5053]